MCTHEHKYCPRCNARFECKAGSILLCQCTTVSLTQDERDYICRHYDDCLCAGCMKAMKSEYHSNLFKEKVKKISEIL